VDFIQCKNYSTTGVDNTINISDLAGFYNFVAENLITNAIVYYSGKLSQQVVCRQNKIKYINIPPGKTLVSFMISLEYKNIIILTPLISTTEQILSHYRNYYSEYKDINYVLVNCKSERNINNIELNENKNIIASTYDSSDIIIKILEKTTLEKIL